MSRTTNPTPHDPARRKGAGVSPRAGGVCPFCGTVKQVAEDPCPRCTLEDTPATREATRQRVGPWYVFQTRNPSAPGMNFATLVALVKKGQVTARSVVRGPTTHQLWRFAGQIKGLSRELGVCYACGQAVDRAANLCPHCHKLQEPPVNPDVFLENAPAAAAGALATVAGEAKAPVHRPAARPSGQEILTPKELAAAFSLSVSEDALAAREAPAGTGDEEGAVGTARRGRGRAVMGTVLVLAVAGCGFWLLFDVEARARVQTWTQEHYATVRAQVNDAWAKFQKDSAPAPKAAPVTGGGQSAAPAKGPESDALPKELQPMKTPRRLDRGTSAVATDGARPLDDAPAHQELAADAGGDAVPLMTQMPDLRSRKVEEAQPAGNRGKTGPGTGARRGTAQPQEVEAEAPKPAQVQPAAKEEPVQSAADTEQANIERARRLYSDAIDLEGNRDYAGAVKKYEEIMSMPAAAWPSDVRFRLEQAKKQMKPGN